MKKLLTLLLALMLPLCAYAETNKLSVTVMTDEVAFVSLVKEMLLQDSTSEPDYAEKYAQLLHKVLNGLTLNMTIQEDAISMDLLLSGGKLLDITAYEADQTTYLTGSMLEGYALAEDAEAADEKLLADLNQIDWVAVSSSIQAGISDWLAGIESTVSRGAFDGDAFKGGTQCTTWMLSDMDIAALLNALLTQEVRNVAALMLNAMSFDAADILDQFDTLNDRVADENRYLYVLRVVCDDQDQLVGISLTILDKNTQVATISFGLNDEGIRLVTGLGFSGGNYWWEFTAHQQRKEKATHLSGTSREWAASKKDGFAYVSAAMAPVSDIAWEINAVNDGTDCMWDVSLSEGTEAIASAKGKVTMDEGAMSCQIFLGEEKAAPLTIKIDFAPAEAIPPMDSTLQICSASDPADAETYAAIVKQASATFLARLMKLLPMDLFLMLNDISVE